MSISVYQSKLYFKLKNYESEKCQIKYLGHKISNSTVPADLAKTEAIHTWPELSYVHELEQFIGLSNYYNNFIFIFSTIAAPLTDLLSTDKKW